MKIKFPNWKTTVSGISFVTTLTASIAGMSGQFPFLANYVMYLLFISMVCGAINSALQKTYNVTGGTVDQTKEG
jgi:hypothetical protein